MATYTSKRGGLVTVYPQADVASARRSALQAEAAMKDIGSASGSAQRIRKLQLLRSSMARTDMRPLTLASVVPTFGAMTDASAIGTGTLWQCYNDAAPEHLNKYTMAGANWKTIGGAGTYPWAYVIKPEVAHQGNGSDPTTNPNYSGRIRFALDAPSFELFIMCGGTGAGSGFRMKVDGQYVNTGTLGIGTNGAFKYLPVTWGAGAAADRKTRYYELEFTAVGGFWGIRTTNLYKPSPWPQPDGLRVIAHGDSMLGTIVDSVNPDTSLTPPMGLGLGDLLGQCDTWASGTGGAGWYTPVGHTQSWFNDRVALDVVANAPDVIIEMGGSNDESVLTAGTVTQAAYQATVETWISTVLAARPETVIFMFGPVLTGASYALGHTRCRDAKAAAAAKWPRNVAFIDNLTDPWFTGTGKQTATAGNGNRDWTVGSDGAHPTMEGHRYLASRVARAVAGAIPGLIAAQG